MKYANIPRSAAEYNCKSIEGMHHQYGSLNLFVNNEVIQTGKQKN
jgi:hypothetical protein